MTWKERILARLVARRLRKEFKMKPLPKWMGWLSMLASVFTGIATYAAVLPPKIGGPLVAVAGILGGISHSLPGTGGKPE